MLFRPGVANPDAQGAGLLKYKNENRLDTRRSHSPLDLSLPVLYGGIGTVKCFCIEGEQDCKATINGY